MRVLRVPLVAATAVGLAVLVGLAVAGGGDDRGGAGTDPPGAARDAAPPGDPAAPFARLADRIAAPWPARRGPTGLVVEPLTGAQRHGYGQAMLSETLMRSGRRRGDRAMLRAGIRLLEASTERAALDPQAGNPLELLGVASAYRWGARHLRGDRTWRRHAGAARRYLRDWRGAEVGLAAQRCFASPSCWNNFKVIQAAALLELLATGVRSTTPGARLADRAATRVEALATLGRALPRAIGRKATATGRDGTLRGLGILSDEPAYPLAYHALSVAALARALDLLGSGAPPRAVAAFRRAMLAQTAFTAPDGDLAYLGRGQGHSWALGATAYAGESCARRFRASAPATAARCAGLAQRAVVRLDRVHGYRDGVLAIVPRFKRAPATRDGLEHYVRVATYVGLTGLLVGWAGEAAGATRGVRPAPLPLDGGGTFTDPDRTRLAVVRRDPVWFAVHATGPQRVHDLRHDFGLVSLKVRAGSGWRDVLRPRPLIDPAGPEHSAGPVLMTDAGPVPPWGRRFRADPRTGEVTVRGGFRTEAGVWALRGVVFRYRPHGRALTLTLTAPPGSVLRFQDYLPDGRTTIVAGGRALRAPGVSSALAPAPIALEQGLTHASSYSSALRAVRRDVTVPRDGRVRWTMSAG